MVAERIKKVLLWALGAWQGVLGSTADICCHSQRMEKDCLFGTSHIFKKKENPNNTGKALKNVCFMTKEESPSPGSHGQGAPFHVLETTCCSPAHISLDLAKHLVLV